MTVNYVTHGVRRIVGVDIDPEAIEIARVRHTGPAVDYLLSRTTAIPLPDASIDTIVCYDVFEHVSRPAEVLAECRRVLRRGGRMLIGTWGWYHPFAPHLWAAMPVPWAHIVFSERTILRTCRRVFHSEWYVTNRHDVDEHGRKKIDKYVDEAISTDYLNKLRISDFEKVFRGSGLHHAIHPEPFGSKYAQWTRPLLSVPHLREFVTSYFWAVLTKV
jgi:SAM-dependent methyltransferase